VVFIDLIIERIGAPPPPDIQYFRTCELLNYQGYQVKQRNNDDISYQDFSSNGHHLPYFSLKNHLVNQHNPFVQ
jgi:hypothetical protein